MINVMKISTGEFDIILNSTYLSDEENLVFWACWTVIVFIMAIIFLNFIVAEASESYNQVHEHIDEFI